MRKMRKFLNILFLPMAFGSKFVASGDGEDHYDVRIYSVGRYWTGDVGMNADNGEPLFSSGLYF